MSEDVPVNPFRTCLYSAEELLGRFRNDDPLSYRDTLDFETYQNFVASGRRTDAPYLPYGHEPPTPIASHIGKYFENSIREDGLLALATWGIVFAEGRAGTIQEIFQDGAQNYYRSFGWFSPMVLLGTDYWRIQFPVEPVLRALFSETDERFLTVTDDLAEAADAILSFEPPADRENRAKSQMP